MHQRYMKLQELGKFLSTNHLSQIPKKWKVCGLSRPLRRSADSAHKKKEKKGKKKKTLASRNGELQVLLRLCQTNLGSKLYQQEGSLRKHEKMKKKEKEKKRKEKHEQEKKSKAQMLPGVEGILQYKLQSVGRKFLGETMSEASLHCVHAHFRHSVIQLS